MRSSSGRRARAALLSMCAASLLALSGAWVYASARQARSSGVLSIHVSRASLPADGISAAEVSTSARGRNLRPGAAVISIKEGSRRARLEPPGPAGPSEGVLLRAGVLPGTVVVAATAPGMVEATARVELLPTLSDGAGDGTPDFLRLVNGSDRQAFRDWFTFLAEEQSFRAPESVPAEIGDCAALIRYAYREALREHDGAWAARLGLGSVPGFPPVEKYQYPFTPLGARLFRLVPGPFEARDLARGAFAEFADAQTLLARNTHIVGRDVGNAEPGDLLFYRQLEQNLPFHAMIFLGPSRIGPERGPLLVYHTGPLAGAKGEIRRPTVAELARHPAPRWRPLRGNANFLGVYRWNILREVETP